MAAAAAVRRGVRAGPSAPRHTPRPPPSHAHPSGNIASRAADGRDRADRQFLSCPSETHCAPAPDKPARLADIHRHDDFIKYHFATVPTPRSSSTSCVICGKRLARFWSVVMARSPACAYPSWVGQDNTDSLHRWLPNHCLPGEAQPAGSAELRHRAEDARTRPFTTTCGRSTTSGLLPNLRRRQASRREVIEAVDLARSPHRPLRQPVRRPAGLVSLRCGRPA